MPSIKSRRTVPDGDERHCQRKSGPAADSLKQRVSSPPARDHLLRVGHHRQRNENSKPGGGSRYPATACRVDDWSGPASADGLGLALLAVLLVDVDHVHGLELGG